MTNSSNEQQVYEDRARRSVFPFTQPMSNGGTFDYMGLQKRELFAAMAMAGYCQEGCGGNVDRIAEEAVKQADALLSALENVK